MIHLLVPSMLRFAVPTLELYVDMSAVLQAHFNDIKRSERAYQNPLINYLSRRTDAPTAVIVSCSKLNHMNLLNPPCKSSVRPYISSAVSLINRLHKSSVRPCNVTSEDSGQSSSSESILLDDEETLQQKLQTAIEEENYAEAAKIRDSLRTLKEDSKTYVLAANGIFYNAFRKGDLATMQTLWARGDNVCCVHPGSSGIYSYDHVMSSWEYVWVDYDFPLEIELRDVQVHVKGDVGCVTCVELIRTKGSNWGRQFATNVFERIDGQWFISVHHASPVDL